ncbi:hypothetical protein BDV97DRAFT_395997 [Delphinella strobiligena]|nr:hypothetical protein BDV97DRAFT_395997 [Delphinella strobiligena]
MSNLRSIYILSAILTTSILLSSLLEQSRDPTQPKPMSNLLNAIYVLSTALVTHILDVIATLLKAILADEQSAIDGIHTWLAHTVAGQKQFILDVLASRVVEIVGLVAMVYVNLVFIVVIVTAVQSASLLFCGIFFDLWHWAFRDEDCCLCGC